MSKPRVGLVVLLAVVIGVIAPAPTKIQALPQDSWETWYYSDDTYAEQVGYERRFCNGSIYREGVRSDYFNEDHYSCGGNMEDCSATHCWRYGVNNDVACVDTTCPNGTVTWH